MPSNVNNLQISVCHFSDTLQPNKHWPTETDVNKTRTNMSVGIGWRLYMQYESALKG